MNTKIPNIFGENLDVEIEGNLKSNKIILFVHGFGTDKNEGFALFLQMARLLKDYMTIRFDLSGYGESQGYDYEFNFWKATGDLDSVIKYINKTYPKKEVNIIAHSLGTFVVGLLSPSNINKVIFTGIPNSNVEFVAQNIKNRIYTRGGTVDEDNISVYPRSNGKEQQIGRNFWKTLVNLKPVEYIEELSMKTNLIIFRPIHDEIIENQYLDEYKEIQTIKYFEIPGNHNFTKKADRKNLFESVKLYLSI